MKTKLTILSAALALGMGCMHAPPMPEELVQARELYENQRTGTTGQVAPAALAEARKSIEIATAAWEKNPRAAVTKDFSYVALRKTQLAAAKANIDLALIQKEQIQRDRLSLAQLELQRTKDELARSKEALSQAGVELESEKSRSAMSAKELEAERASRMEAEKRANQAADELSKISQVKRDSRGVVLTLSGSVTFESGKSEILEGAQGKLDEVAQALIKAKPTKGVVVEGHTDSQGSASFNKVLSQQRADAVRSYLIGQGVPADTIRAEGKGESRSIADNDTAEGRAMNRRVEIVLLKDDAVSSR
jgi:outer membrane protein OmpA-like peptidoglycan-associated protein